MLFVLLICPGITGGVQHDVVSKSGKALVADDITNTSNNLPPSTLSYNSQASNSESALNGYDEQPKRKGKTTKPAKTADRTLMIMQEQPQGGADSRTCNKEAVRGEKQDDGSSILVHSGVESCAWTQRQQKVLEKALSLFPKGTDARWDKIADAVPGKSKVSLRNGTYIYLESNIDV